MTHFDVTGPLPSGTTLLEASAGTGKTFAIAALATRFVAETEIDISQLLLMTFGNHATGELRARLGSAFQHTIAGLQALARGEQPAAPDLIVRHLAAGDSELALQRLEQASQRLHEATVLTTHAFCQTMLEDLGVLGDWVSSESIGPESVTLARQCATDTYLKLYVDEPTPPFDAKRGVQIGTEACLSSLPLIPAGSVEVDFAEQVRALYRSRLATAGLCTFDEVTQRLRRALRNASTADTVRAMLRDRYRVVLVDEFQDTDPDQWSIIENAFVAPDRVTILIGDPKQSIYGFRGADLSSYLKAHQHAQVFTLDTNYRSDPAVIAGVLELFGQATLGGSNTHVTPVKAAPAASDKLILPVPQRLWLRRGFAPELSATPEKAIEYDLAQQIQQLLTRGAIRVVDEQGNPGQRPVNLRDIAILVRTSHRARQLRKELSSLGYPTILTGSQSVWQQPAAQQWAALLKALADPSQATIRWAALGLLVGSQLDELLAEHSSEPARVSALIRELAQSFERGGASAVLATLRSQYDLDARLLAQPDGDRTLSDVAQLAELLDQRCPTDVEAMIQLLEGGSDELRDEDPIRLAATGDAIRIMTMHAAKGLQFPIVLLPETDGTSARRSRPFTIVENNARCLYVGPVPGWRDAIAKDLERQNLEEELRLLYVGLTRAQHLTIAWQVVQQRGTTGPLASLLQQHGQQPKSAVNQLAFRHIGDFLLGDPAPPAPQPQPVASCADQLAAADWQRNVDRTWRRTSYSGLTQELHEAPAALLSDEPETAQSPVAEFVLPQDDPPSLMNGLPAGAAFGTLVHAALEVIDWSPDRLEASTAETVTVLARHHGLSCDQAQQLAAALVAVARTPLAPLSDNCLSEIPITQRLPELDFDLPLADQGSVATVADIAQLMAQHLSPDDPLATYPAMLAQSVAAPATLNGFLTGSIDAVLQLADGRFAVVDYKTNRLGPDDATVSHYHPTALASAMMQAHYPLQAIIYSAALHRYLSLRLANYQPEKHLGGVGYLFVRGMAGPDTPLIDAARCGVFGWFPPADLVVAVSEILGGRRG